MTQSSDSRGARRWTLAEKILVVFTALLALGSAFLGLRTAQIAQAKEQAQASAATKGSDLSTLQEQYDQLKSQNDRLQADNAQLRSPTSPTASSVQREATPAFTKDLTVPLYGSYASIFLAEGDVECCTGSTDLYYDNENGQFRIRTPFDSGEISEGVEQPSKAGCRDAVDTRPAGGPITDLTSGKLFCAATSEGVALLTVLEPPDAQGSLKLQLTFWNN